MSITYVKTLLATCQQLNPAELMQIDANLCRFMQMNSRVKLGQAAIFLQLGAGESSTKLRQHQQQQQQQQHSWSTVGSRLPFPGGERRKRPGGERGAGPGPWEGAGLGR